MTFHKKLDIFTILPSQCASKSIDDLGKDLETNGHISHKIQSFIYQHIPTSVFYYFWNRFFAPEFMGERKIAMEKMKK